MAQTGSHETAGKIDGAALQRRGAREPASCDRHAPDRQRADRTLVSGTPSGAEPVFSGCQRGVGKLARQRRKDACRHPGIGIVEAVRRHLILVALMVFGTLTATAVKAEPGYVGNAACAGCHERANADWTDSHHDLAMQAATPETVLGLSLIHI